MGGGAEVSINDAFATQTDKAHGCSHPSLLSQGFFLFFCKLLQLYNSSINLFHKQLTKSIVCQNSFIRLGSHE